MRTFRTVLEQKIWERRQTIEEFAEYAERFAREHNQPGTLSVRHVQRLAAGHRMKGQPLGPVRPATARLLENIFGLRIEELLAPVSPSTSDGVRTGDLRQSLRGSERMEANVASASSVYLVTAFEWLNMHAGWQPDMSQQKMLSQLDILTPGEIVDRHAQRARVGRSQVVHALLDYYSDSAPGYDIYQAQCENRKIQTSIVTRPDWLDLACPLTPDGEKLALVNIDATGSATHKDIGVTHAVHRLAEAAALDVRVTNAPLYRLLDIDVQLGMITGTVGLVPFVEYALTMDLLENELVDAVTANVATRRGGLPLRDTYLPDLASVLDIAGRLCAGGVLALCAIARPSDLYRGAPDYALLVQERSANVLNATRRLAVIPKGFHQPLKDVRADARIGATLRREMEEELFGRGELDSTAGPSRVAAPMHPSRLSEPMRWLTEGKERLRMECTGFGLNLVSGNYEFASLIVIEDEQFWSRYGGDVEANWETAGLRVYSSLDRELLNGLLSDELWSNEGLFALLQELRRLGQVGGERVNLPLIEHDLGGRSW